MGEIKKVYFFYIIEHDVDVQKEYDPYSGSDEPHLSICGTEAIRKSENYSSIEDALDAQDEFGMLKNISSFSPVVEGWVRE